MTSSSAAAESRLARAALIAGSRRRLGGWVVLVIAVTAVLAWQVLVPLGFLVFSTLKAVPPGSPRYWSSELTLANYARALESGDLLSSSLNSLMFAVPSAAIAFAVGTALAWLVQRTDLPLKTLVYVLAIGQVVLPGLLTTVAWIFLASPRIGLINQWLANVIGLPDTTLDLYTLPGMIWVQSLDMLPLAFLLMSAVLHSMDPALEESANASGAGHWRTFWQVTLPLMRPGALATVVLLWVHALEAFEVPALIGIRAGMLVYSTEIYLATRSAPRLDVGLAGAFAMVLVTLSIIAVIVYYRLLGTGERFATVTGKAYRPRLIALGGWRYALAAAVLAVLTLMFVLPAATIVWASLIPYLQYPSAESLSQVSLANFARLFDDPLTPRAFLNSFILGIAASSLVVLITSLAAYVVVKTRLRGRLLLDALAFVPLAIPGVIIALAILWTYLVLRVPIYGTLWIILAAYLTKYLPVAMRINSAGMTQVHRELEEAALMSGASRLRTLRSVLLPLLAPSLIASWIWVMVHAFREVSVGVMLYVEGTETVGVALFDLTSDGGNFPKVAALGVLIFVLLIGMALAARVLTQRRAVRAS